MTTISGQWRINGNGSQGLLDLASPDNTNLTGTVTFDDTGGRTDPVNGHWDEAAGAIRLVRTLGNGATQTYTGRLGNNDPTHLILAGGFAQSDHAGPRQQFGWAAAPVRPASTYALSLDSFTIRQTRSFHEDTDFVSLSAIVLTEVGYEQPTTTVPRSMGNLNNGTFRNLGQQLAFRLQPNEAVTFSYLILNSGFAGSSSQDLQKTLDAISTATKDALDVYYAALSGIWTIADGLTQLLNAVIAADCDGICAADRITFSASDLAAATATGPLTRSCRYQSASPLRCGDADQDYEVNWSITPQR